jgi:murein DD-endopeptidase MepM/ murein hydrolase activator NlpD
MQKFILFLGIFLTPLVSNAQTFEPQSPLDIPLVLSGTFAELRSNHFHGGIDIKTQGRSGLKVYSVADGYVSRIAVSPYGYGNALYIRHPEGYTSVYGHLNAFSPAIEEWVENQFRDRSKNDGNLYPATDQFPVAKGEFVAFSGNTGGSMGPHLHFEIRDTRTEEPLNPLEFGLKVKDTRKPDIRGLMWTSEDFSDAGVFNAGDTVAMPQTKGFDLFTTDKQDGANNNNGVYAIEVSADGQVFFTANYRRINFSTSRFINAHVNFERYYNQGVRYTRLYELDNNPLEVTSTWELTTPAFRASKGWLTIAKDSVVIIEVSVRDYEGNQSAFQFYLKGSEPSSEAPKPEQIRWNVDNVLENGAVHVFIPSGALYHDAVFDLVQLANENYIIGEGNALQTYMTITWDLDSIQRTKVGWFLWEIGRKGSKDAITGTREGDQMVFETRSTGKYYLDQDLQKPVVNIVARSASSRPNSSFKQITVRAQDDKTGIDRYSARLDGEFVRIDFDYKQDLLKVIVPKDIPAGNHILRVVVIDGVGNTTVEEYTITL